MAVESPKPWFASPRSSLGEVNPAEAEDAVELPTRVPTGVPDFDYLTGGLPSGSVVLLMGEAGAGHQEFALTSAVHLMLHFDDPRLHQFFLGGAQGPFVYPRGVLYVSVTRSKEQVLAEVQASFEKSYHRVLLNHLTFRDLSPAYFSDSVVPTGWAQVGGSLLSTLPVQGRGPGTPLQAVAEAVESDGSSNLVIVDSLTDLVVRRSVDLEELLTLVKGLRRRAKAWGGIVYLLLSKGVAPAATEQALMDSTDGVLTFTWSTSATHSHRQRTMLIERFMPVLSRVPHEQQGRFVIRVSALNGLVTTQYERI